MRPLHQGAGALAVFALVGTAALGTTVSAQEPRPRPERHGESLERTIEAFAGVVERNVERWARTVERDAEKWAEDFERHAEKWAEKIERHAEDVAVIVEVEAAGQSSEAARQARERARERAREQRERDQERAQEQRERARERAEEARERARERSGRDGDRDWRGNDFNGPEVTEQFSRTLRLGRGGVLDIENIAGDITITGGSGTDVRIDAIKRVRSRNEARGRTLLPELQIEVNERAGRVEIRTQHPRQANSQVDYTLNVPSGIDVIVKSISGDVRVTNVRGELRAETTSGDLIATGASRVQLAKTISGDLEIADVDGEVNADTVSGDAVVRNVKGRNLHLETVSGDAILTDIDVERVNVGSINGSVDFTGRVQKGGRYELHSHSGDVRMLPMGPSGFDFEAKTFSGNVTAASGMKVEQRLRQGFAPGPGDRSVRGTVGDGGAFVLLQSFSGELVFRNK